MSKPTSLGRAIERTRVQIRWPMVELGLHLGVSPKTIQRLERGVTLPSPPTRSRLVRWAQGLSPSLGDPILHALGIVRAAPSTPAASAPASGTTDLGSALDHALAALGERLDVGPRTLRRGLVKLFMELEPTGASLATIRAQIRVKDPTRDKD